MASLNVIDLTALNSEIVASPLDNFATIGVLITGTWVGTITFQGSIDGTTFDTIEVKHINAHTLKTTTTANGQFFINASGLKSVKVVMTSYTSGTATVLIQGNSAFSGVGRQQSTLYDSSGTEVGTTSNPLVNTATLSFAPELLAGRLFSTSIEANAATSGSDNPLVLFRNPVSSGKNFFIFKIIVGISTSNVAATFKVFGNPTMTNTVATITTITQTGLSTTVTVTTSGANGATVGATVVITGTTNFNGTYTVASVTSSTIYTFTRTAPLFTQTNNAGTSTMNSSLGTVMSIFPLKRVASPLTSVALANSLPTLPANGDQLIAIAQGQNTTPPLLVDSAQMSLEPGQTLIITGNPNSNNRSTTVTIIWSEVTQ